MSLLHSILLGLVQGVAEFLPISSSGHLAIVEQILGVKDAAPPGRLHWFYRNLRQIRKHLPARPLGSYEFAENFR